ncbi:MAG: bifunctional phosphoglucose/phosphomannose isomerase [Candidatus Shapirobacteria bacterium]|jgi:glucose/mannose-6-phosphate isomerase
MNLDDFDQIKALDKSRVLESINQLDEQCLQAWEEVKKIAVKDNFDDVDKIVVSGMGGSALGAEIIKSVYFDKLKLPLEIVRDYRLPEYADSNTLVILSSYSGTTEEVLAAGEEAKKRGAKIMAISAGGELEKVAQANNWTYFRINPTHNPCGQPRMAIGYSVIGILGLLIKAGCLAVSDQDFEEVIKTIRKKQQELAVDRPQQENAAKKIADRLYNRVVLIMAAEHLGGCAKAVCNVLNENAKTMGTYFLIPEANHHLMEGLAYPLTNNANLIAVMLTTKTYSHPITRRFEVTKRVIEKNNIPAIEINIETESKLAQAFEALTVGEYICFYLAMLNGIDPVGIPWVDYFKAEMKKE